MFRGGCLRGVEGKIDAVAPDIFHEVRKVDKRVAVALNGINSVVTVNLDGAYGVGFGPIDIHGVSPLLQCGPRVVFKRVEATRVCPGIVLIGGYHIHIYAREVALPLIVRLPYREAQIAGTHLGAAIVGRCFLHLTHAPVAFCSINFLLAGHQVVQVFVGLHFGAAPPAFGERVLNVSAWYRTAVAVKRSDVVRIAVNHVAVIVIGVVKTPPCAAHAASVCQCLGIFNNIEGGGFQLGTLLSAQCIIIARRYLCPCIADGHEHDCCQQHSLSKCFLHKFNGSYGLVMMYRYHFASAIHCFVVGL